MEQERIGKCIAKLRKQKGLTQEQFGEKISVTGKTVSKWETGHSLPDILMLKEIATVLDISVSELLSGEDMDKDNTKIEVIDSLTISTIKKYNTRYKKKIMKISLVILIIVIIFFSLFMYYDNYYDYTVFSVESNNNDFIVDGYVTQNIENTIISINSINYIDNLRGTEKEIRTSEVRVELYSGENFIASCEKEMDKEVFLGEIISEMNIFVYAKQTDEERIEVNSKKMQIIIKYKKEEITESIIVPLK